MGWHSTFISTLTVVVVTLCMPFVADSQTCTALFPTFPGGACTSVTAGSTISVSSISSCPANSRTIIASATAFTDCKCVEGYYGNITNLLIPNQCLMCAPGTYSVGVGQTSSSTCQQCPAGSYCASVSAAPMPCNSSYICPAGSISQSSCPSGNYCPSPASKFPW